MNFPGWLNNGSNFVGQATIGRNNGNTFRSLWKSAKDSNVSIVMVQAFNQWTGCQSNPGENYTPEMSTDIEPMQGGFGDLYLRILAQEIQKFKQ